MKKVCMFGLYDRIYFRNTSNIQHIRALNCQVIECPNKIRPHAEKEDKAERVKQKGFLWLALRLFFSYLHAIVKIPIVWKCDAVFCGKPGHLDVLFLSLGMGWKRVPIIFDAFFSLYDTIVNDRMLLNKESIGAKVVWWVDYLACRLATHILVDTEEHKEYFMNHFKVAKEVITVVPVCTDETLFNIKKCKFSPSAVTQVLFYGTFVPLQGIEYIVKAAKQLEQFEDIRFTIVGRGQESCKIRTLAKTLNLDNIHFYDWVEFKKLPDLITGATICLGVFGSSKKASRVIPNKLVQAIAMAKPVITAETEAVKRHFTDGESILLCPPADESALTNAILRLHGDVELRERIGKGGYEVYKKVFSEKAVRGRLEEALETVFTSNFKHA